MADFDWSSLSSFGGSLLSGVGGVVSTILNNSANQKLNEQNIAMQRETNAQNLALQQEQWAREDNAAQRRANDLEAAGLSKTLAAGSSATSTLSTSMQAPRATYANNYSNLQNAFNVYSNYLQNRYTTAQIDNAEAEAGLTKAQMAKVMAETPYAGTYLQAMTGAQNALASSYSSQAEYYRTMTPLQANNVTAQTEQIFKYIDYLGSNIALNGAKLDLTKKETSKLSWDISESIARANYLNAEAKKAVQQTVNLQLDNAMNTFDFNMSKKEGTKTKDTSSNTTFTKDLIMQGVKSVLSTGGYVAGGLALGLGAKGAGVRNGFYSQFGDYSDIRSWRFK